MKNLLTTVLLAAFVAVPAFAQVGEVEERVIGGKVSGETRDYLLQNNNLTDQERSILLGQQTAGNVTRIAQTGTSNIAIIQQVGIGNVTNLNQDGNNNTYQSLVEGNDNLLLVNQIGNNNIIEHEVRESNREIRISQEGHGLVLRKSEMGTTPAVPVEITQQGQGMQITITNGRID